MASMNVVALTGNVTRDPRLRSAGETSVLDFGLAFDESRRGKDGQRRSGFVDVAVFGRYAEAMAQYVAKGDLVGVTGRLRWEEWEDKSTGARRTKLSVVATELTLFPRRERRDGGATAPVQGQPDATAPQAPQASDGATWAAPAPYPAWQDLAAAPDYTVPSYEACPAPQQPYGEWDAASGTWRQ